MPACTWRDQANMARRSSFQHGTKFKLGVFKRNVTEFRLSSVVRSFSDYMA